MKILILDDDDSRHRRFAQWFAGYDVTHTFTYNQFIREYAAGKFFDYVFLDHDLNDCQYRSTVNIDGDNIEGYTGPCIKEMTGQDAARFIVENDPTKAGHVVVHSWNPSGALEMESIIGRKVPVTRWVFNPKEDLKLK